MSDKKDSKKKAPEAAAPGGDDAQPKKKSKLLLFLMIAVGALVLVGGSVGATLYFTGFFAPKTATATDQAAGHEGEHGAEPAHGAEGGHEAAAGGEHAAVPEHGAEKSSAAVPQKEQFTATYKPIERDFTINIPNSRKFVQFKVAFKTFYGDAIVERVTKHQIAVEAAILTAASQFGEEEMVSLEGRARLATSLRDAMNDVLIRNEDFGGIEEVMFTHFVFQ